MKIALVALSVFLGFFNETPEIENPIVLNKTSYELSVDDQVHILHSSTGDLVFESLNPSIASVSTAGLISGVSAGSTQIKITASVEDTSFEAVVDVLVKGPVGEFKFKQNEFYLIRDLYYDIEYTLSPTLDKNSISWTSSDPSVARVENGRVYGLKIGSTLIRGTLGDLVAEMQLSVTVPLESVSFNPSSLTMTLEDTLEIPSLVYVPYDTTSSKQVAYSVSNPTIVDLVDGKLVAMGVGDAEVYVSIGSIKSTLNVRVNPKKSETGSEIITLSSDGGLNGVMNLSFGQKYEFSSNKYDVLFPVDEILEFLKSNDDAKIRIVLPDKLLSNGMAKVDSFKLPAEVFEPLADQLLSIEIADKSNKTLIVYHFDRVSSENFNLKFSLEPIEETAVLYQKIGARSYRLRFANTAPYSFVVEIPSSAIKSTASQYHFLYKLEKGSPDDTNQMVQVDENDMIRFKIDSNDYAITFSRISVSNNTGVIVGLLALVLTVSISYGVYYFKVIKKRRNV